jgi:chromosome segregation ATPase
VRSEAARREEAAALQAVVTEAVEKEGKAVGEAELASQSLQRAQAEEARLSESSAKQTERIELLQRSLSEAKDRLRSQSADVSRLASASSESRADHEATVQSLRSAIAALRDSLQAEQKRSAENEQRLAALSGECETLRQAVASLEATAEGLRAEAEMATAALAAETARGEALRVSWVAQEESHVAALESLELSVIEQMRSEQEDADALVEGRAVRAAAAMVGARRRQGVGRCFSAWARLLWMEMAIAAASSGMAEQAAGLGGFQVQMSA